MNVVSIVGARPQFIKAAPVSAALRRTHREYLVHTGQHYDHQMSEVFFDEMGIPAPNRNLDVGSGSHGAQTGAMLRLIEECLLEMRPDVVLVYGDTNSTLAGALAAAKLGIPLAHVEAGLRSYNRSMPEEHNRVLADHAADLLLCPTDTAVVNLAKEGLTSGVHLVGDTMYDAVLRFREVAAARSNVMDRLDLSHGRYVLATIHRPYNTDDPVHLRCLVEAFSRAPDTIVFPVHPRTRRKLDELELTSPAVDGRVRFIEPVGYLDMLELERHARVIVTDSGGVQKEAYFLGVPCLTVRPETEWVETVAAGWNRLVAIDRDAITSALSTASCPEGAPPMVFGDGRASEKIVDILGQCSS
jgi:UDP-GlcNAc3NAcA epimerase